jgi:predicted histone-like DNA-binding protein
MPVTYKLVQKGNPANASAPKKFYATPAARGRTSIKEISKDIADISSLNYGDISNVLNNFVQLIPKYLANGNIVSLGELGDLRLNFSSEGTETESAFTPSKIRNVKIAFRAGSDLKTSIKGLTFTKTT